MKEEVISVIVPVYNTEKYLRKCVQSIQQQTYQNLEIILVDDGSTDNSGMLCDELAKQDKRLKVIHQENQGLSAARNSGIREAKGEYLAFVDSDDYIYLRMYQVLYEMLIKNEADIAAAGIRMTKNEEFFSEIDYPEYHKRIYTKEDAVLQLFDNYTSSVSACNKLYRRKMFQNIVYPVGKKHEDEYITYQLLYKANRVVFVEETMYAYIQRKNSIVHSLSENSYLDKIEAYIQMMKFCKKYDLIQAYQSAVYRYLDFKRDYYEYCTKYKKELKRDIKLKIIEESSRFGEEFQFNNKNKMKRILFNCAPIVFLFLKNKRNKMDNIE